ncbi:hypothetical protein HNY73_006752 [Argiope bruennichi]|uniref:PUB domain-containing protein n=1 Tax=Argiope bruennichi TaxID=94029 RepID=A0A8T0FC77_ARGBR|nr:hypothetical protein HNY73_006752 [Argiope bruennichi]
MIDKQALRKYLDTLIIEHESKISRTVIETLLKIHRKILCNENEAQFRSINPDNPIFLEKVWSLLPARQFMKKCGWFFDVVENAN